MQLLLSMVFRKAYLFFSAVLLSMVLTVGILSSALAANRCAAIYTTKKSWSPPELSFNRTPLEVLQRTYHDQIFNGVDRAQIELPVNSAIKKTLHWMRSQLMVNSKKIVSTGEDVSAEAKTLIAQLDRFGSNQLVNHIEYVASADMFSRIFTAIEKGNSHDDWTDRDKSRDILKQTLLTMHPSTFLLPMHEKLTTRDFVFGLTPMQIQPLGIVTSSVHVDGLLMTPVFFFRHDLLHAALLKKHLKSDLQVFQNYSKDCLEWMKSELKTERERTIATFILFYVHHESAIPLTYRELISPVFDLARDTEYTRNAVKRVKNGDFQDLFPDNDLSVSEIGKIAEKLLLFARERNQQYRAARQGN